MIRSYADQTGKKVYWLDDESAVIVDDKRIEVVGSGDQEIFE
jgi:hypothetical protein